MFIGYPDGYKGWKFYNPTTKCTIISECADFDERNTISSPTPTLPSIQSHTPRYTAPDIEDTPEDNALEAPRVLHPGGHLILLGSRTQNPTPQLQHLNHSQMLLRLHLLHLSLCRVRLALVCACLEEFARDLKNGGNSAQHSWSTMTRTTLMTKKLILCTVLPLIQHIPGHSERP